MATINSFSRRKFLKTGALALAGTTFVPNLLSTEGDKRRKILSLQLYSVREEMKNDPINTLKALAAMGYQHVEHAGYKDRKFYGYPPKEFKKLLGGLGMKMRTGHTVLGTNHWDTGNKQFTDLWKKTVEDAAIAGQKLVISPWIDESYRKNYETFRPYMDVFNKSGELCNQFGMKFGYHNHHFEFMEKMNGELVYDIILKNTDPKLVTQQLDTGNLYNGGAIALDVVQKWPGRFESMHVKDEIEATSSGHDKYESTILGAGIVNLKNVVELGKTLGGTKYFVVEQESYQGKTPLQCMKENYLVMKEWGF
jgi:sugar phosphate isomerase/epimerase